MFTLVFTLALLLTVSEPWARKARTVPLSMLTSPLVSTVWAPALPLLKCTPFTCGCKQVGASVALQAGMKPGTRQDSTPSACARAKIVPFLSLPACVVTEPLAMMVPELPEPAVPVAQTLRRALIRAAVTLPSIFTSQLACSRSKDEPLVM